VVRATLPAVRRGKVKSVRLLDAFDADALPTDAQRLCAARRNATVSPRDVQLGVAPSASCSPSPTAASHSPPSWGSWFGAELDAWSSRLAPTVAILGVPFVIVGNCIAAWGSGLSLLWDRITHFAGDLRDYRQLTVLWRALRPIEPVMVHKPTSLTNHLSPRPR
jgi:hypothetical protein